MNCMGFVFLNNIKSVVLTDVNYPTIEKEIPQVALEEIKSVTYRNESSVRQQQTLAISKTIIKTTSWSVSDNISATFSVEVKAGLPGIGEASAGLSTTVGKENTYSHEDKNEKTTTFSINLEVPPRKKVDVNVTVGRCSFDLPYTGTVMMSCKNGRVFSFKTKGQYKGVTYTDIKINTKELHL
ncbi:hypothetical protein R3I93_001375 [Phoxinus phoxinus]|uniref:Aerolysin-like C-terminal domain-containing protein n=1 Tax=Phoxinus phoxinus TaxID=58324 RepID=A0AAN9DMX0_9TELE